MFVGPPLAVDDTYLQAREGPTEVTQPTVFANDTIPCLSTVKVSVVDPPMHGKVDLRSDGSFVYTPDPASRMWRQGQQARAAPPLPKADSFTYEITCPDTGLVRVRSSGNVWCTNCVRHVQPLHVAC